jgi:hypothetical protein
VRRTGGSALQTQLASPCLALPTSNRIGGYGLCHTSQALTLTEPIVEYLK